MPVKKEPVFIKPKDLFLFFIDMSSSNGVSKKYNRMREMIGKEKHQPITVWEFAEHIGLPPEFVLQKLTA